MVSDRRRTDAGRTHSWNLRGDDGAGWAEDRGEASIASTSAKEGIAAQKGLLGGGANHKKGQVGLFPVCKLKKSKEGEAYSSGSWAGRVCQRLILEVKADAFQNNRPGRRSRSSRAIQVIGVKEGFPQFYGSGGNRAMGDIIGGVKENSILIKWRGRNTQNGGSSRRAGGVCDQGQNRTPYHGDTSF